MHCNSNMEIDIHIHIHTHIIYILYIYIYIIYILRVYKSMEFLSTVGGAAPGFTMPMRWSGHQMAPDGTRWHQRLSEGGEWWSLQRPQVQG